MCELFSLIPDGGENSSLGSSLIPSSAVDSKLAVPLYLFDGFHCRAIDGTAGDYGIQRASLAKEARVQLSSRKYDASITNKETIPISRVLSEASSAWKLFYFFDRLITAISCYLLSFKIAAC